MSLSVQIPVDPALVARRVFFCCLAIEVGLVLLDYHVNYGRLTEVGAMRRLTNIAREDSLASWVGTTQTLLVALTAWVVLLLASAGEAPRWRRTGWLIAAVTFTYMAVDDGAHLHERFGTLSEVLQQDSGPSILDSFPSYAWQVLFVPAFGLLGLLFLVFVWYELRDRTGLLLVVLAIVCLVIAVALDFVEGLESSHPWNPYTWITSRTDLADFTEARFRHSPYSTLRHFSRSLAESLEMLAMTLLWVTFLRHLPAVARHVHVRVAT